MIANKKIIVMMSFSTILTSCQSSNDFNIAPEKLYLIKNAWSVNTAGPGVPPSQPSYYSLTVNGEFFPGLRPWELRWDLIKNIMDYSGKNILELGCCMGLVSTCIKKYCNAANSVGVDGPDYFLISQGSPYRIQAAKWVAQAFEVDVQFIQTNFNIDDYESAIGYDYDVVFCFSLLHWIKDKQRFMNYLSHFSHVIFEGHDSDQIEINRFAEHGFNFYEIIGHADRGRTIIHFFK